MPRVGRPRTSCILPRVGRTDLPDELAGGTSVCEMSDVEGTVRLWDAEEGWGILDSAATPGGCWAHFSALEVEDYRVLNPDETVILTFEAVEQDGFDYRALSVRPNT